MRIDRQGPGWHQYKDGRITVTTSAFCHYKCARRCHIGIPASFPRPSTYASISVGPSVASKQTTIDSVCLYRLISNRPNRPFFSLCRPFPDGPLYFSGLHAPYLVVWSLRQVTVCGVVYTDRFSIQFIHFQGEQGGGDYTIIANIGIEQRF